MNPGLCEAVTGRQNAQAILTALHRANSFVIPLDDTGQWFRYHHLFADLLQARLTQAFPAQAIAALHSRAAAWCEHNGLAVEAVNHALAAGDFERAASLVDQAAQSIMSIGQFNLLKNWLEALPEHCFHAHPRLGIYQVLISLSQGTLDMSEQTLQEKENLIRALPPSPENDRLQAEALVYLCLFLAHQNTSRTIQLAQAALAKLPEGDPKLPISLYSALYRAYGMDGDIEKSEPAYLECLRLAHAAGKYSVASNTTMVRAFDLCQYGRLREAARYCQSIIEAGDRLKQKAFYPAGPAYIGLAGIHLEWDDLETAEDYLTQGIELCHLGGMDGLYAGYTQRARLHQARGDLEGAWEELSLLERTFQRRDFTLTARQVSIRLAMGDMASASRLKTSIWEILGDSPYARKLPIIAAEALKLSLARIYIAQGEIGRADQVLDEIQATVEPGKRLGRLMEVHLLRALALQKRAGGGVPSEAVASLERALELAEPAGFVLLFLEEGRAHVPLLHVIEYRQAAPDRVKNYARKLLGAFGGIGKRAAPRLPSKATTLVEPLTTREMEVLELIAAGDSNQAIAEKLVITVRTVKKHTSNIFQKLSASSRIQAVARARELGLLATD
jgi:LuxR family maltose regulon positive regulatory protein